MASNSAGASSSATPAVPPAGASSDKTDVAANSGVSTPAEDNAAAGATNNAAGGLPDLASITSNCQTNPTNDISQYLGGSGSNAQ
jgi:hypothetical protein